MCTCVGQNQLPFTVDCWDKTAKLRVVLQPVTTSTMHISTLGTPGVASQVWYDRHFNIEFAGATAGRILGIERYKYNGVPWNMPPNAVMYKPVLIHGLCAVVAS